MTTYLIFLLRTMKRVTVGSLSFRYWWLYFYTDAQVAQWRWYRENLLFMWEIKLTTINTIGKNIIWIWLGYTPKRPLTCAILNELKVFRAGGHQPSAGRSVQLLNLTGRWIFRPARVETVWIVPTDVITTTRKLTICPIVWRKTYSSLVCTTIKKIPLI